MTPAVMDEIRYVRAEDGPLQFGFATGIPFFKREDMPEGWPDL